MELKTFFVADSAGKTIGGIRSPGSGKEIKMSELQAQQPLRKGEITAVKKTTTPPPPPPGGDKGGKAD